METFYDIFQLFLCVLVPIYFSCFEEYCSAVLLWSFIVNKAFILTQEWEDNDWIFIFGVNRSFNKRSIDKNKGKIGKSTRKWAQLNFIFSTNMGNSGPLFSRIHSHFKTKCKWISSVAQESNFPEKDFFFFFHLSVSVLWQTGLNSVLGLTLCKQAVGPVKAAGAC